MALPYQELIALLTDLDEEQRLTSGGARSICRSSRCRHEKLEPLAP